MPFPSPAERTQQIQLRAMRATGLYPVERETHAAITDCIRPNLDLDFDSVWSALLTIISYPIHDR